MINSSLLSSENEVANRLCSVLKNSPKRIVFTDGEDIRVIKAASKLVSEELIAPILLGSRDKVYALAEKSGISMKFINVIQPEKASDLDQFEKRLERVEKFRGRVVANAREMICNPHNFGAMMVQYGQADGLVAGNLSQPSAIFRSLKNFIKPTKDVPSLFGVVVIHAPQLKNIGSEGVLFMADCGVNPEPSMEELASFGVEAGKLSSRFIEGTPKVAFLSHSTYGSMKTASSRKMAAATALARDAVHRGSLALNIVGEVQLDVALDPSAAEIKQPDLHSKPADVVIYPNLDASHISSKMLQHVGGAQGYGQLILGLTKPAAQVPVTTSVEMLLGTAVLVGVEAAKGREIHFDWK